MKTFFSITSDNYIFYAILSATLLTCNINFGMLNEEGIELMHAQEESSTLLLEDTNPNLLPSREKLAEKLKKECNKIRIRIKKYYTDNNLPLPSENPPEEMILESIKLLNDVECRKDDFYPLVIHKLKQIDETRKNPFPEISPNGKDIDNTLNYLNENVGSSIVNIFETLTDLQIPSKPIKNYKLVYCAAEWTLKNQHTDDSIKNYRNKIYLSVIYKMRQDPYCYLPPGITPHPELSLENTWSIRYSGTRKISINNSTNNHLTEYQRTIQFLKKLMIQHELTIPTEEPHQELIVWLMMCIHQANIHQYSEYQNIINKAKNYLDKDRMPFFPEIEKTTKDLEESCNTILELSTKYLYFLYPMFKKESSAGYPTTYNPHLEMNFEDLNILYLFVSLSEWLFKKTLCDPHKSIQEKHCKKILLNTLVKIQNNPELLLKGKTIRSLFINRNNTDQPLCDFCNSPAVVKCEGYNSEDEISFCKKSYLCNNTMCINHQSTIRIQSSNSNMRGRYVYCPSCNQEIEKSSCCTLL